MLDWKDEFHREHASVGGNLGHISGGLGGRSFEALLTSLPDIKRESKDTSLLMLISKLEVIGPQLIYQGQGYAAYEQARNAAFERFRQVISSIESLRR